MAVLWLKTRKRIMIDHSNLSFYDFKKEKPKNYSDIIEGLMNEKQKKINSKYFYDEYGSSLFDAITLTKDYYPTKKEMEILDSHNEEFSHNLPPFASVIEFGSGSNKKVKKLLKVLNQPFEYIPMDISKEFLYKNAKDSAQHFPELKIKAVCADFNQIDLLNTVVDKGNTKIGFFPGSTIGNYCPPDARELLKKFANILGEDNFLIIGVDLKKNIKILERAYNDSDGFTEKFNKNILNGVNNLCGTYFNTKDFNHKAFFNTDKSRIEMHLVSKKKQVVDVLGKKIIFKQGESIHTENSYKYSLESFSDLVEAAKFKIVKTLTDKKLFFGVFFLKVKGS